jgi:hypothetical protein
MKFFAAWVVLTTLPLLAGTALAGQPLPLDDTQLDGVTAGAVNQFTFAPALGSGRISSGVFLFQLTTNDVSNTSTVMTNIDPIECATCYLNIKDPSFTIQAMFGPSHL